MGRAIADGSLSKIAIFVCFSYVLIVIFFIYGYSLLWEHIVYSSAEMVSAKLTPKLFRAHPKSRTINNLTEHAKSLKHS
jgi:hypothetical protein